MARLCDDLLPLVFKFLPQETLAQCRLVSRTVEPLASAVLFCHVRLEFDSDPNAFLNITRSERLRPYVRELTVDLSQLKNSASSDMTEYADTLRQREQAIVAFPLVRFLTRLRTLNLRFGEFQGLTRRDSEGFYSILPSIFTETIIQCVCGGWTKESQDHWESTWSTWYKPRKEALSHLMQQVGSGDLRLTDAPGPDSHSGTAQHLTNTAVNIKTLTISNLLEWDSEYLLSSPIMRRFFETQSLSTLQILMASGSGSAHGVYDTFGSSESILKNKYKLIQTLPSSWLSPPIANRLRTLSLFSHEYWGWCPKMDLRVLGGLPNLRTLALGHYVISHQWQVDWIAQLGADNGRGGLEELYLDNCRIMWQGRVLGPVDDEGFPLEEVMTEQKFQPHQGQRAVVSVSLRWNTVLDEWCRMMPSLKAFRMGRGDWHGGFSAEVAMAQTASRERLFPGAYVRAKYRTLNMTHVNYDKPPIEARHRYGEDIIRDGVGLTQKPEHLLRYVQFEIALGSRAWAERDLKDILAIEYEDGEQRYEEARQRDEDALEALKATIAARNR
jgi:hypothetical protein